MRCIRSPRHKFNISASVSGNSTNFIHMVCKYYRISVQESGVFVKKLTYEAKSGMLWYVASMPPAWNIPHEYQNRRVQP